MDKWEIRQGGCLDIMRTMPDKSVHCCVTSPPYWGLRDYGVSGQLGLEPTPEEYVAKMVEVFREVWRVLRDDGTLWLNLGDCYNSPNSHSGKSCKYGGSRDKYINRLLEHKAINPGTTKTLKPKDLVGQPWRVAFALQADGWYLRSDIIWSKPNPMPESVTDRPTKAHEYIFLLSKSQRYYYDHEAIKEPTVYEGKNNGVGFGHGTDKELRARDRVRGSVGVINNPLNSALRKSGNLERKIGSTRGRPDSHLGGSVPWEGTTRNKRSVWTVATQSFSEAHFATFPPKLIEPCILAGTSPQTCPKCGSPWKRIIELGQVQSTGGSNNNRRNGNTDFGGSNMNCGTFIQREHITTGWQPTCSCPDNDGSGNPIVLDPFSGAGTTGMVSLRHGRRYIGIELKPEYVEMSRRRIEDDAPLFNRLAME